MWTSQVYGHRDKMARTKTQRTSQNTKYTKTFICKHSLNTSLPLLKVSQVLKRNLFSGASFFHICMYSRDGHMWLSMGLSRKGHILQGVF